ncbi:MAG: ABC transporter permease subunit [Paenibacillaceae bacterium]
MVNLIQNENMKIYRRIRTWIMAILLVFIVIAASLISFFVENGQEMKAGEWRTQLEQQQTDYKTQLAQPELNKQYEIVLTKDLALVEYQLENSIPPLDATMWGPINGLTGLVFLITLFVVIVAGDSLAGEFSTGTIKLLLIRPASRLKIMLSKYFALIIFGLFLLLVLFVSSFLINGALYGFSGWSQSYLNVNAEGIIQEESTLIHLWQTYFLGSVATVMYVTLAFMISAVFRSSAMAIGISIFAMFAGLGVTAIFQQYPWSKYSIFANIDLTQHINGSPFRDEMTMGFSVGTLIVYFVIFNVLSWAVFTRRDVAA